MCALKLKCFVRGSTKHLTRVGIHMTTKIAFDVAEIGGSCITMFDSEDSAFRGIRDALRDDNTELRLARLDGGIGKTRLCCVDISPVAFRSYLG